MGVKGVKGDGSDGSDGSDEVMANRHASRASRPAKMHPEKLRPAWMRVLAFILFLPPF
jgi:hypothetical protein